MTKFKPFTTTLIGSLPRTKELLLLKESSNNSSKYEKAVSYTHLDRINIRVASSSIIISSS